MNRFFALLLAASCLTAFGQVPDYVPTEGLVGWWAFDGDALDQSGNENHGVTYGVEFSHDRFGNANMAATFGMNRWIQIGHSPSIDFVSGDSLTWAIWMKTQPTTAPYGQVIFQKWNGSLGTSYPLSVGCGNQGNLLGSASFCHSDQSLGHDVSTSIGTDTWLHGLMTQTPDSAFLYVNGMLVSASAIAEVGCGNAEPLNIGKKLGSIPAFYEGELDDFGLWNRTLSEAEILGLYNTEVQALGCTDQTACNYDAAAIESNGSCDYSCCPGPGCCGLGMHWDWNLGECAITNPSDSNLDGCVQLNDLLDLLSAYGDCGAVESAWQCGDFLEYQGYDYETVQIGEQCWYAENVRFLPQVSSPYVGSEVDGQPHAYVYGFVGNDVDDAMMEENYTLYGALYNYQSLTDWQLCPSGWHVGNDEDFATLELFAGMALDQVNLAGGIWRGIDEGHKLKSNDDGDIWLYDGADAENNGGGSDQFGFSGIPSGGRISSSQAFASLGSNFNLWTPPFARSLAANEDGIWRRAVGDDVHPENGVAVRCIKD